MIPPYAELGAFGLAASALLGLVVGSFLNVVAHRLPREESLAFPGSRCPSCGAPIAWHDNVPVVSWILLRGRCRSCRAPIGVRYPALELGNAILWALVFFRAPAWCDFFSGAFLCSASLVLLAIDYEHWILPDEITYSGIFLGLALSFCSAMRTPVSAVIATIAGGGGLFVFAFLYGKRVRREAMGFGDFKMVGMVGALLGIGGMIFTVMVASLAGSIVGICLWLLRGRRLSFREFLRTTELQFGVFLGLGSVIAWFFARDAIGWYFARMVRPEP